MGKKKPKEPQGTLKSDRISASTGIFSSLFGNAPEQSAPASLFSDKNPFRRKPRESGSGVDSAINSENPCNGGSENEDSGEHKRKRNKEKNSTHDSNSVIEASVKKLKMGSDLNPYVGPQSNRIPRDEGAEDSDMGAQATGLWMKDNVEGEEKDVNLGLQSIRKGEDENEAKERRRNKRKRDELEKEWEARKYGAVEEDEREGLGNKIVGIKRKVVDNPAGMLVSKEGFDDENKLLRTIFVGNLPLKVKKKTLMKEFKKFGEVESVRIRSVPILDTKKPRKGAILSKKINDSADSVHAYIVFKTDQSAQDSLSHNMAVVGGNHIRVDRACPPRKKLKGENASLYDNKRTVFVGNLPFDVKDEELFQLFSSIANLESSIEAVRVIRDPHINLGKGIAYVLFKTREAANLVVKKRNLKLRDRELRLSHARADATPSKRPNSSPAQTPSNPSKKLAVASRSPSSSNNKASGKANMSYQGLRATKTGVPKKFKSQEGEQPTERKEKRPAVAARKSKSKLLKDGGPSKQSGIKRKLDSRTPDSSLQHKKIKKNR